MWAPTRGTWDAEVRAFSPLEPGHVDNPSAEVDPLPGTPATFDQLFQCKTEGEFTIGYALQAKIAVQWTKFSRSEGGLASEDSGVGSAIAWAFADPDAGPSKLVSGECVRPFAAGGNLWIVRASSCVSIFSPSRSCRPSWGRVARRR